MDPFVPFARWFTNEKQRELDETRQMYEWVKQQQAQFDLSASDIALKLYNQFMRNLPHDLSEALGLAAFDTLVLETFLTEVPAPAFERMSLKEFVEYRSLLHKKLYFFMNKRELLDLQYDGMVRVFGGMIRELPLSQTPS